MTDSVQAILKDLISIPSVSSVSNAPVIDYVEGLLDASAWLIHRTPYIDPAGIEKVNAIVRPRTSSEGQRTELTFVCHTDTVPFDPEWKEAIAPAEQNGRIYGRGSCDAKGFLACVLKMLATLDPSRLSRPLALVLTADEEVGCLGAKRLAQASPLQTRFLIVGEPTGLQPVRAGKGYCLGTIVVTGRECHSAYPEKGRSAIFDAARVLLALEGLSGTLRESAVPGFDPPYTTLNVGLIQGGSAKNIVPGNCTLTIEWRPVPGQCTELVPDLIRDALDALRKNDPVLDVTFEVLRQDPAFAPSPTAELAEYLSGLTGQAESTISFGSEAPHLAALSEEAVVFGPGDMTVAHRTGEYVEVAALEKCAECLRAVVRKYCEA